MVNKLRRNPKDAASDFMHRMKIGAAIALAIFLIPYFVR